MSKMFAEVKSCFHLFQASQVVLLRAGPVFLGSPQVVLCRSTGRRGVIGQGQDSRASMVSASHGAT